MAPKTVGRLVGSGKRCVCGPLGCKKDVTFEGFRLPANIDKRRKWLCCFYPEDEIPEQFLQRRAPTRRVHPCHFEPNSMDLKQRAGGSGALPPRPLATSCA